MARSHRSMRVRSRIRLMLAGWFPGRNVIESLELPGNFQLFPEAVRVLSEYGGLTLTGHYGVSDRPSSASVR